MTKPSVLEICQDENGWLEEAGIADPSIVVTWEMTVILILSVMCQNYV